MNIVLNKGIEIFFSLISSRQPCNAEDAIFPDEKYDNIGEIIENEGRERFREICAENLSGTFDNIKRFIEYFKPSCLRIYVSLAYDPEFEVVECTLEEMKNDILEQIVYDFFLESRIYEVNLQAL